MRGSRLVWVAGLLALVALIGVQATHAGPDGGHAIGIWPIGTNTCVCDGSPVMA